MAWLTADELTAALKAVQGWHPDDPVAEHWTGLVAAGLVAGRHRIARDLAQQGYTAGQVAAWDELAAWHRTAGLYYTLVRAGLTEDRDRQQLRDLRDELKELAGIVLMVGGETADPAGAGGGGGVAHGDVDAGGRFSMDMTL